VGVPTIVSLLSLLGLVPLLILGFGAVGAVPFVADRMLVVLVDYVAVMLTFAGGVHWGVGLLSGGGRASLRLTALAEQQKAVATWRSVMADLRTSTTGLGHSLHRYNASLGALSDKVSAVHRQAQALEQWADSALATHSTPDTALRH
jgi:hypothetical protein